MAHGPSRVHGPFLSWANGGRRVDGGLRAGPWRLGRRARYERLAGELRAAGHRVVVAALTGLGVRSDELHPGITLTDHVDDVCDQIAEAGSTASSSPAIPTAAW